MKPLFSHSYTDRTPCIFVPFVCARVYVSEWFWFWVSLLVRCFFPFDMMSTWWRLSLAMDKLQWSLFFVIVTLIGHHVFLFHLCARVCEWEILWFWVSPLVHDLIIETYKEERCLIAEVFHKGIWVCSLYTWTVMRSHSTNLNYK